MQDQDTDSWIDLVEDRPAPAVTKCPNCDYDLAGLASGICPECGQKPDQLQRSRSVRVQALLLSCTAAAALICPILVDHSLLFFPLAVAAVVHWGAWVSLFTVVLGLDSAWRRVLALLLGSATGFAFILGYAWILIR